MSEVTLRCQFTRKQKEAWDILHDEETVELVFGGGGGGGKSRFGVMFGILMCVYYPGTRGAIARKTLKDLKETTLLTMFDVLKDMGFQADIDFVYYQDSRVEFPASGSAIYLKELDWMPSDPDYDRLGSTEYTWGFIDEAQQVRQKAKNALRSRIRYKLKEHRLRPRLLMTCNPSKGWLYTSFYRPSKDGTLTKDKKFLQSLAIDNPFIDPSYIETLRGLDVQMQERLLYGNWEYDDDPSALMRYDALTDLFSNVVDVVRDAQGQVSASNKAIICDVARFGKDRTTISYWEGLRCVRLAMYEKLPTVPDPNNPTLPSVAGKLNEWRNEYQVPLSRVLVDEDGVGGGVVDYLHCKGFMGGRKPFPMPTNRTIPQNYINLRSQCYFKLAEYTNGRKISVPLMNPTLKDMMIQELEQIKAKDHDKDGKLQVIGKDDIKEKIGRSPDIADNLMMRMWFEFAPHPGIYSIDIVQVPTKPAQNGERVLSAFERGE